MKINTDINKYIHESTIRVNILANVKTKNVLTSKTIWVNLLFVVAGIVVGVAESVEAGSAITLIGVLNLVLRSVTKQGIDFVFWKP